jgi:hypothetical protein
MPCPIGIEITAFFGPDHPTITKANDQDPTLRYKITLRLIADYRERFSSGQTSMVHISALTDPVYSFWSSEDLYT